VAVEAAAYELRGNNAKLSVGLASALPGDVGECHVLLRKLDDERQFLRQENERLQNELITANAEIRDLQDHARYRELRKLRSRYGKQGGRGNAK
jgi:flagellar motility protein MotE (MotC chaperone)